MIEIRQKLKMKSVDTDMYLLCVFAVRIQFIFNCNLSTTDVRKTNTIAIH